MIRLIMLPDLWINNWENDIVDELPIQQHSAIIGVTLSSYQWLYTLNIVLISKWVKGILLMLKIYNKYKCQSNSNY